jgi:two-component system, cell cycle sensor histidine kinase and response regulator CckA
MLVVPHHYVFLLSQVSLGVVAGVLLVERRGRHVPLDPRRQIEIRTLLDSMPEMVAIIDATGHIVDTNEAATRLFAIPREQLVGSLVSDLTRKIEAPAEKKVVRFNKSIVVRALAGESVLQEHREVRHPQSGTTVELLVSANPIRTERGEIQGAMLIARDVTELGHLQKRLADIERHQAIGHVAAGIAHDFNNTLQTISQAVSILQLTPDRTAADRKVFLDMIQNAVQRGAEVISRIRDYLRSGTSIVSEVDLCRLIEDSIELTRPMWQTAYITLNRELKGVPTVRGNAADLRRVFTNLIINSVQAMPQGGSITLGCEGTEREVHAWVKDSGPGIPADVKKRIFDPYFTTKAGGTGLGLSGAQKILLELGGQISFQSEPGKGTQFDLILPVARQSAGKFTNSANG